MLQLRSNCSSASPWVDLESLVLPDTPLENGSAVALQDADGNALGTGIFDARDPQAAWRRFSWDPEAVFDLDYIVETMEAAVQRRPEESCLRLIHNDADYLPGLTIDLLQEVLLVTTTTAAMDAHLPAILEVLMEGYQPREILIRNDSSARAAFALPQAIKTYSGNPLKGFWIEVDALRYRVDPADPEKPLFPLEQREQFSLVGSLCGGRSVLDLYGNAGAFALQALKQAATSATVVHPNAEYLKVVGANAQRNCQQVEVIAGDPATYLAEASIGQFECITIDPPAELEGGAATLAQLQSDAFRCLPAGGVLATYCRDPELSADAFEALVTEAAAHAGREARLFARIAQPFDFPILLNLSTSQVLSGLILQVE